MRELEQFFLSAVAFEGKDLKTLGGRPGRCHALLRSTVQCCRAPLCPSFHLLSRFIFGAGDLLPHHGVHEPLQRRLWIGRPSSMHRRHLDDGAPW